jgi:hypothetical protein
MWPRKNRIIVGLPRSRVNTVKFDIFDSDNELVRSASFFPKTTTPPRIAYEVDVPSGLYRLEIEYEVSKFDSRDGKTHGVDWTRVGVQHQVRLEGEEYRFPPPEETR